MSKRVLVTGASGFAGFYLVDLLSKSGYHVGGLSNHMHEPGKVDQAYIGDLSNLADLRRVVSDFQPSHVVHLAAISFVGHENAGEIYATNVVGTRNLLVALSELPLVPEAVLLVSSANIYGSSGKSMLAEDDAPNPANDYAVSKIAMEYMARQFTSSLNIVIARPFNYTGLRQSAHFLVPKIVKHFRERRPTIELGNLDVSRDFSDVRKVVWSLQKLIETSSAIGQVYNICSGVPHSLAFIIETCERVTGHHLNVLVNPAFVRSNEVKSLAGDPSKLTTAIGEGPKFSFEETLTWMLQA